MKSSGTAETTEWRAQSRFGDFELEEEEEPSLPNCIRVGKRTWQ